MRVLRLTAITKCFWSILLFALVTHAGAQLSPQLYFEEALRYIQTSVFSDRIDWQAQREKVAPSLGDANSVEDVYPLIRRMVQALGDNHSQFYTPREMKDLLVKVEKNRAQLAPTGRLEEGMGYISLPAHSGRGLVHGNGQYANVTQAILRDLDQQGVCGWIVDLRKNHGGNPYVMWAGVGPLLGEGRVGAFVYANGERRTWYYREGRVLLDKDVFVEVPKPYVLRGTPPVAVLLGSQTASAAEAVAIAFQGRPHTRSFGSATSGVPTGLLGLDMPDGAVVSITVAFMADRTGKSYASFLEPDVQVYDIWNPRQPQADLVIEAAHEWLSRQPHCSD